MFKLFNNKFWAADDNTGGGTIDLDSKNLTKDDIYDALGEDEEDVIPLDDDKKTPPKETPTQQEADEEEEPTDEEDATEDDELAELERELEPPDEDKLELVTPVRRKEILAKYPKLFKDFPYLEKAYYRDQQFTEVFPSIDDARAASEKASSFDQFGNQLMQGHSEQILKSIKQEDEGAWHKFVDNYMVALWNTDQIAYNHVVGNINKTLIASMVNEGKKLQNDALISAAAILNQFVFGTGEWSAPTRLSKETTNPQNDELTRREQEFNQRQFDSARGDLQTRVTNVLKSTIEQNIDKQGSMTDYVKRSACNDAMHMLERLINADTGFQRLKDKLWQRAYQEGYSKPAMDKIRSAFTTKAKTLLPSVLKKARAEALKGLGKRVVEDTEDRNDGTTRAPKSRNTTSSSSNSGRSYADKAKQIPKGMSTYDYLKSD